MKDFSNSGALVGVNVVAFFAVMLAAVSQSRPIITSRPHFTREAPPVFTKFGTVEARGWEDPIEAVRAFYNRAESKRKEAMQDSGLAAPSPTDVGIAMGQLREADERLIAGIDKRFEMEAAKLWNEDKLTVLPISMVETEKRSLELIASWPSLGASEAAPAKTGTDWARRKSAAERRLNFLNKSPATPQTFPVVWTGKAGEAKNAHEAFYQTAHQLKNHRDAIVQIKKWPDYDVLWQFTKSTDRESLEQTMIWLQKTRPDLEQLLDSWREENPGIFDQLEKTAGLENATQEYRRAGRALLQLIDVKIRTSTVEGSAPFQFARGLLNAAARDQMNNAATGDPLVLAVFVEGTNYVDTREVRLRSRYAVQAALSSLHYRNSKAGELYYFEMEGRNLRKNVKGYFPFAVEVFLPESTAANSATGSPAASPIYVCWLDESCFKIEHLLPAPAESPWAAGTSGTGREGLLEVLFPNKPASTIALRAIHLGGSDAMADAVKWYNASRPKSLAESSISFPKATATEERIRQLAGMNKSTRFPDFQRPELTDRNLISALRDELRRRIPNFDVVEDTAIVAEWDTGYARGTVYEWYNLEGEDPPLPKKGHVFPYLRGLDGESAASLASAGGKENSANSLQALKSAAYGPRAPEIPADQSQFDYLRRLAKRLAKHERPIRAVGIVGTDVYDKVSILQAMRPSLPNAVFFTMDLDAQFLHPAAEGAGKNLLVASLNDPGTPKTEKPNPDEIAVSNAFFRDTYQVAVFDEIKRVVLGATKTGATLSTSQSQAAAGGGSSGVGGGGSGMTDTADKVKLFEVGNFSFHEVVSNKGILPRKALDAFSVITTPLGSVPWNILLGLLPAAFLTAYGYRMRARLRTPSTKPDRPLRTLIWICQGLVVVLLVAALVDRGLGTWEPMFLWPNSGVSAWPGITFTLACAAISTIGLRATMGALQTRLLEKPKFAIFKKWREREKEEPRAWIWRWLTNPMNFAWLSAFVGAVGTLIAMGAILYFNGGMVPSHVRGIFLPWAERALVLYNLAIFSWLVWYLLMWHASLASVAYLFRKHLSRAYGDLLCKENDPNDVAISRAIIPANPDAWVSDLETVNDIATFVRGKLWFVVTAMFLFLMSRAPVFDTPGWTPDLVLAASILALPVFAIPALSSHYICKLRIAMEWFLNRALPPLDQEPEPSNTPVSTNPLTYRESLDTALKGLRELTEGAFAPWYKEPIAQGILILVAGVATIQTLNPILSAIR